MNPKVATALLPLLSDRAVLLNELHMRSLLAKAMHLADAPDGDPEIGDNPLNLTTEGGKVAVINLIGVLTKYPTWADRYMGFCPAYDVMNALREAIDDNSVETILLHIDSPGGFVNGSVELADAVAAAAKQKPVIAYVSGLCCSGAYWIASQATKIVCRPESEVGNIGVYSVLADLSKAYQDVGIDLTLVASGQFKGLGADGKVTDDLIADTRRIVDGLFKQFVAAVATGRKMKPADVVTVADGRAYLGEPSKQMNLVDAVVSSLDAALTVTSAVAPENQTMANNAKSEKDNNGPTAEDVKSHLNAAIKSASDHRDQARKTMDAYTAMDEDGDDEMKSLATRAAKSLRSSSAEAQRCAKVLDPDGEGDTVPGDTEPQEPGDGQEDKASLKASDYIAAFGDSGARWFLEKKPIAAAAQEFIASLKASHKVELDAVKAENAELKAKLAAIDRGNEAASFDAPEGETAPAQKKFSNLSPNLQKYAAGIKIPQQK
ncbi:MAG TPA: S49 family peptidase [Tepidisphaeraceae bacterium]|nr:S49 family peptidase [Tepidisphaeraceae bacterium]